jgi:hypothetical protein
MTAAAKKDKSRFKKCFFSLKKTIIVIVFFVLVVLAIFLWYRLIFWPLFNSFSKNGSNISLSVNVGDQSDGKQIAALTADQEFLEKNYGPVFFASFFDSFVNIAGIASQENLFHDSVMTAITFPPDYQLVDFSFLNKTGASNINEELAQKYFSGFYLNDFNYLASALPEKIIKYYDKRCLGKNCLEQKGNLLFYNGQAISLPKDVDKNKLAALSIGLLGDPVSNYSLEPLGDNSLAVFMLGVTLKDNNNYRGLVYRFDGHKFTQILEDQKIVSPYFGLFGFGGGADNFLVIYGAEKGLAYQIRDSQISDISRFFDFRIMTGGFKPEILRAERSGRYNWYIFSLSSKRPALIKLWENDTANGISGALSFGQLLGLNTELGLFMPYLTDNQETVLLLKIGENNYQLFHDNGFKNESSGILIFKQMPGYRDIFKMKIRKIDTKNFNLDEASVSSAPLTGASSSVRVYLKEINNSQEEEKLFLVTSSTAAAIDSATPWSEISLTDKTGFSNNEMEKFRLKLVFLPHTDKFQSPFLSEVTLNYYYSRN